MDLEILHVKVVSFEPKTKSPYSMVLGSREKLLAGGSDESFILRVFEVSCGTSCTFASANLSNVISNPPLLVLISLHSNFLHSIRISEGTSQASI